MPLRLRERLAQMSDAGVSFTGLVNELEIYKETMPQRQYDELWLFCWALAKRQAAHPLSRLN
jgi:hypothetical protein